ncbi:MAG: hypothetical protein HN348_21925 [Proteobacteria bacterium]|nr:hypothetical protein [Pseudomonadota bacterium]
MSIPFFLFFVGSGLAGEPDPAALNAYFELELTPATNSAADVVVKTEALNELARSLYPLSRGTDPAAALALLNMGRAYEDFAAEWNALTAPHFLPKEAAAEFGAHSASTALPFCQKARDAYGAALKAAKLPPSQLKLAQESAQRLDPTKLPPMDAERLSGEVAQYLSPYSGTANPQQQDKDPVETLTTSWATDEVRTCRLAKNW